MPKNSHTALVVCGPTACGKTRLAIALARRLDGEIISADSRQVYCGMDIGTGKDLAEYTTGGPAVPYHCIDVVAPTDTYTVSHFQQDCARFLTEIHARGRVPIICGGTGMYIEAVLRRYDIPEVPENPSFRAEMTPVDKRELEKQLLTTDPALHAKTDCSSAKRIVRALEIAAHRAAHPKEPPPDLPDIDALVIGLNPGREETLRRIDARLSTRLDEGMIDEVLNLHKSGIPWERLDSFGMEYRFIARYLQGLCDFDEMKNNLKTAIHQLAKRQMTYFRGFERRGITMEWIERMDTGVIAEKWKAFTERTE